MLLFSRRPDSHIVVGKEAVYSTKGEFNPTFVSVDRIRSRKFDFDLNPGDYDCYALIDGKQFLDPRNVIKASG
jgi:hypothetical protein